MKNIISDSRNKMIVFSYLFLILLLLIAIVQSEIKFDKEYYYSFNDKATYEKCKKLLNDEHEGYILYDYQSQNDKYVAYVRKMVDSEKEMQKIYFDSKKELDTFIEEKTISCYEGIPQLQYGAEFDDSDGYIVSYYIHDRWPYDVLSNAAGQIVPILVIWAIFSLIWYLLICRKNEK